MTKVRNDYQTATDSIKRILKQEKMTYRDFAARLGLSESGLKKILSSTDGSFQRIIKMGELLGLSTIELLEGSRERVQNVYFTSKQQDFLMNDAKGFTLYWMLVYERETVEDCQTALGLTAKTSFSLLRKMDQLQLLELLPKGRVRVPALRQVRWVDQGPLVDRLYRDWSVNLIKAVASAKPSPDSLFLIRYFKVRPQTYADFKIALRELDTEFSRRATHDMRSKADDLMHLRYVVGADNESFIKHS